MSFIRPEIVDGLRRYQEVIWGGAVFVFGAFGLAVGGFISLISVPIALVGVSLVYFGVRRARFQSARAHVPISDGVVEMVEQELTFFSSGIGATIAVDQVVKIEIETNNRGPEREDMYWVFYQRAEQPVRIPSGAVGADEIFDALVAFPSANYENVTAAARSSQNSRFLIWQDEGYISQRKLH